jgi:hypothetical protein
MGTQARNVLKWNQDGHLMSICPKPSIRQESIFLGLLDCD